MPERSHYPAGAPSWADLATADMAATAAFYGGLFGWDVLDLGPEAGGYGMFTKGGKKIAGVGPQQSPDQPPVWTVYVNTDDVDKTVELVTANGGAVFMPPMDVMSEGRMAIAADPTGAVFGLWQPGNHTGADLHDEPGALGWVELSTRDTERAREFYTAVFGWDTRTSEMGAIAYTEFTLGDDSVAGMMATPAEVPAEVPAHWTPYFVVADTDEIATRASALGGIVAVPPADAPHLRFAVLADPHGSMFGVYTPAAGG